MVGGEGGGEAKCEQEACGVHSQDYSRRCSSFGLGGRAAETYRSRAPKEAVWEY
jgi:hypothetical protein